MTDRLTSSSRKKLLNTLQEHVYVDFTVSNICAVIIWVIKNANTYIDSQLLVSYGLMVDKCNVQLYKSNQKTWVEERWRYSGDEEKNSHYALDYRIVTHRIGGISNSGWLYEKGLQERAAEFIGDLLTIARNLGFHCNTVDGRLTGGRADWVSNKTEVFRFVEKDGSSVELFDVKAFKNGNLHLRLNKMFILALNVEHGRLRGWLRSGAEAAEELRDPKAAAFFNSNIQLASGDPTLMLQGVSK